MKTQIIAILIREISRIIKDALAWVIARRGAKKHLQKLSRGVLDAKTDDEKNEAVDNIAEHVNRQ